MTMHSSILAWRIPCSEETGGLQSIGSQTVRHDWVRQSQTWLHTHAEFRTFFSKEGSYFYSLSFTLWLNTMLLFCSQSQWWNVFSLHLCCPWWMKSRPLVELFSYWNYPQEFNRIWNSNSLLSLNNIFNVIYAHSVIFKFCISRITSHSFFPKQCFLLRLQLHYGSFFFNTWSYPPLCT